jgi:molecular chaperone HscA
MSKISINMKAGKADKATDVVVGIDLGTTNSLVAYMKDGQPVAVRDSTGQGVLVPSVIHFAADGSASLGVAAKQQLATDPENTIYSVKRLLGKSYADVKEQEQHLGYRIIDEPGDNLVKIRARNKFYTPIDLSAMLLRELKRRAESELGVPIGKAVITVPAYFNDAQRQATRDAGKLAGLDVLRIVNEPTAASLAYGLGLEQGQTVAVYDLGGGTFDVSILHIQDDIFEVLATNGDTFLGGDDFDRAIVDYWALQHGIAPNAHLRILAEKAKKQLSANEAFQEEYKGVNYTIDKKTYESLIAPLVDKTLDCCQQALADAQLTTKDIERVVLVGGATRTPLVKREVARFFGQDVFDELNPDEVVALGAAIQADVLAGNQQNVLLLDITPLSLGIETVGGLMDVIIPRNAKVPNRAARQYTTSVDGQRNLKVSVYQGERDLVEHNRKLGEFVLRGIPPMPAGLPKIEIAFMLDADGILTVRARELRSNVEQSIEVRPSYGISEEKMAEMLLDSIKNATNDMQLRAILEATNEANNVLLATERFLSSNAAEMPDEAVAEMKHLADKLRQTLVKKDKDAINAAMDELNAFALPYAQAVMDSAIGEAMKGKKV